jgi:hypothetical protein
MSDNATEEDVSSESSPEEAVQTVEIPEPEVVELTMDDLQDDEPEQETEEVSETEEAPEAEEAAEEPQEEPEAVEEPEPEEKPKKSVPKVPLTRLQKEISKRKELEKQLAERAPEAKESQNEEPPQTGEIEMPTLASSGYDESAYQKAMAEYTKNLVRGELQIQKQNAKKEAEEAELKKQQQDHESRINSFLSENEEYQNVLSEIIEAEEDIQYPPAVAQAIQLSDNGPELDLLILKNREELLPKLHGLQPVQQLVEIGKLQAQLDQPKPKKPPAPKPITKAPDPIKTTVGSGGASSEDQELKKLYKDFVIK